MGVVSAWVGATTEASAVVVVEVETGPAALSVATNSDMTGASTGSSVPIDGNLVAKISVNSLDPDTDYWYQVVDDGATDTSLTGHFRTHPAAGSQASFSIVAASCAGAGGDYPGVLGDELVPDRVSNAVVFDTIRARNPLMFVHLGDRGYYDLGSDNHGIVGGGSRANYVKQYRDNARQPRQLALCSQVATAYVYDDHDWGPNDSDGSIAGRDTHLSVYRQMVPHYQLASLTSPVDQYWTIGRVGFVLSDARADRSPNGEPDGPSKSMLGTAQKARLESFLATTDAEAIVWFMPSQWLNVGDGWGSFPTERDELVNMLSAHGWLDRIVMVYGDRHALGITGGATNNWGGFPILQAASMDTSFPGNALESRFDVVTDTPGRNQYGVIDVTDSGEQISITLSAWRGTGSLGSYTHSVTVDEPPPPPPPGPEPGPPQVAVARIRRRLTWLGVDAVTGRVIAELPDIRGEVSRLVSAYTSSRLTLPLPTSGPGHIPIQLIKQATQPISTAIVVVVNDIPTWMGWVLARKGGTGAEAELACATPEAYLLRRKVRDHSFVNTDRALIAEELVGDAGDLAGVGSGIGFDLDVELAGDVVDERIYLASDRSTVYEDLRELAASGTLEFTVDLDWTDSTRTAVRKILRIRPRIGRHVVPPEVLFEATGGPTFDAQSGSDATYSLLEDSTDGRYANYLIAYGPGEGEDQPASAPAVDQAALDHGTPIVERHWQPSSTVTDVEILNAHAQQALELMSHGAQVWEIDARLDAYPRPGVDVLIGDDVAWLLKGHWHPTGVVGRGRMMGYHISHERGRWRPILLDPQEVAEQ